LQKSLPVPVIVKAVFINLFDRYFTQKNSCQSGYPVSNFGISQISGRPDIRQKQYPVQPQLEYPLFSLWVFRGLLRPEHYDFWLQLLDIDEDGREHQAAVLAAALAAWPQHLDFWELHIHLAPVLLLDGSHNNTNNRPEVCGQALRTALNNISNQEDRMKLWKCYLQVAFLADLYKCKCFYNLSTKL
jgi:hypothetical protein